MEKILLGNVIMNKVSSQEGIFPNKTREYLLPCIKEYGPAFIRKFNDIFKVAIGIGDIVVINRGLSYEKHLFILLDTTIANTHFIRFLEWIRSEYMYQDDYVFGDIQKSKHHMIVIKFPEKFHEVISKFYKGKYSEMFKQGDIETYFSKLPDTQKILIKDHNYKIIFVKKLNSEFGTQITPDEYDGELDFPPRPDQEVFNNHLK